MPSTEAGRLSGALDAPDATLSADTATRIDEKITDADQLPYWLVNVPRAEWPSECPEFLRDLPLKNIRILSTPDESYLRQDWAVAKKIVGT
jgi:hypothetical protein